MAALSAIAADSPVPVAVELDPGIDGAVPSEIARAIYFVAAELVTNVVKHSRASAATMKAALTRTATGRPTALDLWVVDNGRGGALPSAGHGLDGLQDRVAGLRGRMAVQSPAGGPTTVGVHVPLPEASESAAARRA